MTGDVPRLRINKRDDEDMPPWLLPKKSQQAKGAEAVEARYTARNNICPVHNMARNLMGSCDDC